MFRFQSYIRITAIRVPRQVLRYCGGERGYRSISTTDLSVPRQSAPVTSSPQTEARSYSAQSASYSASMLSVAVIVCQVFNDSLNEVGLRSYSLVRSRNLSSPCCYPNPNRVRVTSQAYINKQFQSHRRHQGKPRATSAPLERLATVHCQ